MIKREPKKIKDITKDLKEDFATVSKTEEGRRVLRYIMNECGYQSISIVGNPGTGDIHDRGTLYNEARRNLYLDLRKYIPVAHLKLIEFHK